MNFWVSAGWSSYGICCAPVGLFTCLILPVTEVEKLVEDSCFVDGDAESQCCEGTATAWGSTLGSASASWPHPPVGAGVSSGCCAPTDPWLRGLGCRSTIVPDALRPPWLRKNGFDRSDLVTMGKPNFFLAMIQPLYVSGSQLSERSILTTPRKRFLSGFSMSSSSLTISC